MTEEQLIKACIKEDAASQKELFLRFSGRMLGVCNRYARNSADAEDILQDAFIKVFDKMHQFKFEGSFEGWIRRIVVNTALKKYSVSRYDKEVSGYEIKEKDESVLEPSAYSHLSEKELLEMINNLPDGYRIIFNLYVIEGYQHDEIAEMLQMRTRHQQKSISKSKKHASKAAPGTTKNCCMSENGHLDEFIKRQFSNSSPEVPSRVWENIMAARENKKPKAFWWRNLEAANILAGLAILIACSGITWVMVHHNNSAKTTIASTSVDKQNGAATSTIATVPGSGIVKQNNLPASSPAATGNNGNNNVSPSARSSFNNSTSNNSTPTIGYTHNSNRKAVNHFIRWRVNKIRSHIKHNRVIGDDENQTTLVNNEKTTVSADRTNTDQTVADSSELSGLSSSSIIPPVLSFISAAGDAVKRSKVLHLPECPTVEKAPSRERDYIQFYAGPDYGIRTLSDPGDPQYVKARDSSSHFTSGFSFGGSYTKVFKNGLSLREGLNYGQINEWFTAAKNNSFTVYSIDQAGDTLGKTITYKVTHNHYSTLDIPLTIGYEFALDKDNRFMANINAGAIINIFSWQNGDVLDTSNNTVHITTSSANYSPYLFKTVIGVGFISNVSLYYKLSDNFSVVAEPYFRYNFQPMTQNTSSFSEKYTTIGLHLGVRIDLH